MPEEIFKPFTGKQVIKVDGVCYKWVDFTPEASETPGAITEEHDQCSDCSPDVILYEYSPCIFDNSSSSSSVIVPFPAACAGCGSAGDVHWVFGNPTDLALGVTNASFNVDDNSSTNEIVWFAFTEGVTEYSIKYTQQEFEYTAGGKSINQITISETGQPDIVYSLTGSQDGTLKDGSPFGGSDVFVIGSNVAQVSISERIIDSSSNCCIPPGSFFGMLGIDVHFNDGLYGVDSVGGALWYIWKTAKDESGAVNTLSMEGVDGIGDYLATGSTGFSARSSFEGNAHLEAIDITALQEISNRMSELQGISGLWDADWDPLAEEPYECEINTCGTPNADPTIFVTLSWTDLDDTKNYLGCTWCNGETKEVYAVNYVRESGNNTSTANNEESWAVTNGGSQKIFMRQLSGSGAHSGRGSVIGFGAGLYFSNNYNVFYNHGTNNIASDNINEYNIEAFASTIQDAYFGFVTTTSDVTITWTRGNNW